MTIQIKDKSPKTYVVLGAHQGGTSIISKALHGVPDIDMGIGQNEGTYEDNTFVQINNNIIRRAGGVWYDPPAVEHVKNVAKGFSGQISSLINSKKKPFWGWKDPRTALTWDAYKGHLSDDVYLVCVFRKPDKVGESLSRRSNPKVSGKELSKEYYRRIIDIIKDFAEL